eukprot:gb/GEZN01020291.1/.p1 GENE.gb/GEZN01020291.1/~~gb/GEZN01020291.1/.p1  ORF type:complete len:164 (-),score=18.02 gb/GEZN01020291.1/:18-509(-)
MGTILVELHTRTHKAEKAEAEKVQFERENKRRQDKEERLNANRNIRMALDSVRQGGLKFTGAPNQDTWHIQKMISQAKRCLANNACNVNEENVGKVFTIMAEGNHQMQQASQYYGMQEALRDMHKDTRFMESMVNCPDRALKLWVYVLANRGAIENLPSVPSC